MSKRRKSVLFKFQITADIIRLLCDAVHKIPKITTEERISTLLSFRLVNRKWSKIASEDLLWNPILDDLIIDLSMTIRKPLFREVVQRTYWGRTDFLESERRSLGDKMLAIPKMYCHDTISCFLYDHLLLETLRNYTLGKLFKLKR